MQARAAAAYPVSSSKDNVMVQKQTERVIVQVVLEPAL
jgi:hypothetical protein